ncbi:MAG: hypothetical protein NTU67_07880 [Gemmatimonadetes bacterium]|nr:hypothetical protein [Gemmatimonadota bacterium]
MLRFRKLGGFLATFALLLQGCYESLPLQQGAAPTDKQIEFVLNDAGRVALAPKLGAAVEKVRGNITAVDGESYTMAVTQVLQYGGGSATWNGEKVVVLKGHTVGFQVRQLDKTSSTLLAGVVIVGIVALFFGKSLLGLGDDPVTPSGTGGQSLTGSLH